MAAQGALALVRAQRLARTADCACALSLEALQGSRTSFLPQVHALRPLRGQVASAANVLRLLDGSAIMESHRWCDKVQDAYSLRCAPQVHGASRDLLDYVEYTVTTELNAATDNPLVLVEDELLVSAGNFHGQPLAFALDALAMAVSELASISERRVERLVNPNLSDGLPAVPHLRRRAQLRLHDPAVRRRLARLREQVALPSCVGRLDPDERRPGGPRVDGQRIRAEGVAGDRELPSARSRSSCSRPRRRSSSWRRSSRAAALARRTRIVRTLSPRLRDDRPLGPDIEAVATAIRDGSLLGRRRGRDGRARMSRVACNWGVPDPPPTEASVPRHVARLRRVCDRARPRRLADRRRREARRRRGRALLRRRDRVDELSLPLQAARAARRRRAMTVARSIDATVEALCGDLSRDPRAARAAAECALAGRPRRRCACCSTTSTARSPSARGARRLRRLRHVPPARTTR